MNVNYSWLALGDSADAVQEGSVLRTSWRPGDKVLPYICKASNPVSSIHSHPILAGAFCAGTSTPEESSELAQELCYLYLSPALPS